MTEQHQKANCDFIPDRIQKQKALLRDLKRYYKYEKMNKVFLFDEKKVRLGNKGFHCWVFSLNKSIAINLNVLYKFFIFICRAFSFPGSQSTLQTLISQQYLIVVWLLSLPPRWWNKNRERLRNLPKATWGKFQTKTICCFCICNNEQIKSAIIFFVTQKKLLC